MTKLILVLFGFVGAISFSTNAQEKINLSAGFGQTEFLNAGIRGQINQTQLALSLGTLFIGEVAISGDVFFHFAGHSKFTERHPWYFRTGISYIHFKENHPLITLFSFGLLKNEPINVTALNLRLGRDFNITETIGVNADFGLAFLLDEKEITSVFSVSVFYRSIKK